MSINLNCNFYEKKLMSTPISAMEDDEDGRFCFKPERKKIEIL
jgi:hypothetical protein